MRTFAECFVCVVLVLVVFFVCAPVVSVDTRGVSISSRSLNTWSSGTLCLVCGLNISFAVPKEPVWRGQLGRRTANAV